GRDPAQRAGFAAEEAARPGGRGHWAARFDRARPRRLVHVHHVPRPRPPLSSAPPRRERLVWPANWTFDTGSRPAARAGKNAGRGDRPLAKKVFDMAQGTVKWFND